MLKIKPKTIYLDLDETLIHSIPSYGGMGVSRRRVIVDCGLKKNGKRDRYTTDLRDIAIAIVKRCQKLTHTKILTSALKEYAEAHVEAFNLGIAKTDIIAREDFLYEGQGPYGSKDIYVLERNIDPTAVLIDNAEPTSEMGRAKTIFLGIPPENFLKIKDYPGGKETPSAAKEIWDAIETIEKLFELTQNPTSPKPKNKTKKSEEMRM